MEELIKRLERVIATGAPDKDGMHPISAETVLEVVKGMGMSYRKHLMTSDEPPSELYKAAEVGTNLAEVGADCISRQQAIDAAIEAADDWDGGCNIGRQKRIEEYIRQLPPAEPKIIRCKDCKNWDTTWTNDFSPNYHYCPMVDGVRKEDWFCADADRRTE